MRGGGDDYVNKYYSYSYYVKKKSEVFSTTMSVFKYNNDINNNSINNNDINNKVSFTPE